MVRTIGRVFVSAVRMAIPWLIRLINFLMKTVATSVSALWLGIPFTTNRLADIWSKRLVQAGIPNRYEEQLYSFFVGLATALVATGWIVLSFITVGLLVMIF